MANVKRQQLKNRQKSAFRTKLQILECVVQNRAHILEINQYVPKVFVFKNTLECEMQCNCEYRSKFGPRILYSYFEYFIISILNSRLNHQPNIGFSCPEKTQQKSDTF